MNRECYPGIIKEPDMKKSTSWKIKKVTVVCLFLLVCSFGVCGPPLSLDGQWLYEEEYIEIFSGGKVYLFDSSPFRTDWSEEIERCLSFAIDRIFFTETGDAEIYLNSGDSFSADYGYGAGGGIRWLSLIIDGVGRLYLQLQYFASYHVYSYICSLVADGDGWTIHEPDEIMTVLDFHIIGKMKKAGFVDFNETWQGRMRKIAIANRKGGV